MERTTAASRRQEKPERDTYTLRKPYTSRCGLKVCSYVRVLPPAEQSRTREAATEETVRILRAAGRL